jgi:hypothetical protein
MNARHVLHTLVDELPEGELTAAQRFLEYLRQHGRDPLRSLLDSAPLDDEPLTDEDRAAIEEAREEKARGDVVSQGEVERLLSELK